MTHNADLTEEKFVGAYRVKEDKAIIEFRVLPNLDDKTPWRRAF
jgi:hypothetical protein